jgi:hypothetical protein
MKFFEDVVVVASLALLAGGATQGIAAESYDFGRIPLGREITRLPDWARDREGCATPSALYPDHFADCWFTDASGLKYIVFDGLLVAKSMSFSPLAGRAPYGLRQGDSKEEVIRKVQSRLGATFDCYTQAGGSACNGDFQDEKLGPIIVKISFDADNIIEMVEVEAVELALT